MLQNIKKLVGLVSEEIESCNFEPTEGATLEPQTNTGKLLNEVKFFLPIFEYSNFMYVNQDNERMLFFIDFGSKILTHVCTTVN